MVKVRGQSSNGKTVKLTASENMARASVCDVCGATSPSCKVTRAIRNVYDQPERVRRRPTEVNLFTVKFKTIPQPQVLDAWYLRRITSRVFVTRDFLAIFGRLFWPYFDLGLSPSDPTKKTPQGQRLRFWSAIFLLGAQCSEQSCQNGEGLP